MTSQELIATNREITESYVEAWRERDPQKIVAHFAEDGVRRWEIIVPAPVGGPNRFIGQDEIIEPVRSFLTAFPDLTTEVRQIVGTDAGGIFEWRHTGTHTAAWNKLTPQGESMEFSGVSVLEIADGKITEERLYFDPWLVAREWAVPLGTLASMGLDMWRESRAITRARKS